VITGNVVVRAGGYRNSAGICVNGMPGGKLVNTIISNNTVKDAQFYGMVVGSDLETITMRNNIIDHPAQTALWIQGGAKGSANIDSCRLINRIARQLAFKNDAPSTFTVTWGQHNYGMPDTLPVTAANSPLPFLKVNEEVSIIQSHHALVIHRNGQNAHGIVRASIYDPSGRLVWSGQTQGANEITCPVHDFSNGAYVMRVTAGDDQNDSRLVTARTVVLSSLK
jgi:hypothetical protein